MSVVITVPSSKMYVTLPVASLSMTELFKYIGSVNAVSFGVMVALNPASILVT